MRTLTKLSPNNPFNGTAELSSKPIHGLTMDKWDSGTFILFLVFQNENSNSPKHILGIWLSDELYSPTGNRVLTLWYQSYQDEQMSRCASVSVSVSVKIAKYRKQKVLKVFFVTSPVHWWLYLTTHQCFYFSMLPSEDLMIGPQNAT